MRHVRERPWRMAGALWVPGLQAATQVTQAYLLRCPPPPPCPQANCPTVALPPCPQPVPCPPCPACHASQCPAAPEAAGGCDAWSSGGLLLFVLGVLAGRSPAVEAMTGHVERHQVAWLRYRVAGPALYHQRLLLKQLRSSVDSWVVLTPDGDMYVEDLEVSDDIREVLYENIPGVESAQVRGCGYRFGAMPSADGLRRLAQQAESLRDQEDAVRGYRAPAEGAGSQGGFEPVGGTETPRGAPGLPPPLPPPLEAPGPPGRWVIAIDTGEGKVGDSITVADVSRASGDTRIGVAQVSNGAWVFVERHGETKEEYLSRTARRRGAGDGSLDARVLPVTYNSSSVRQRPWRETVAKMSQVTFSDWPLPGPRTVDWCARFVDRRGGGPVDHRRWWVGHLRLQSSDFGVQEHEHGMRAFQFFGEYDQVDLPNLVGLEVTLRRCHLIEYHYEKKGKAATGKEQGAGLSREEAAYFTGSHRLGGEVMICPELIEWVSKEIEKDASVAKQMRKAREEARLSRKDFNVSRKVRRRLEARSHADQWCADVARSLNEIGGHLCKDTDACRSSRFRPRVHDLGMARVRASVERCGRPPADLTCQGAFDELRANHSYEGAPAAVAPMDIGLLSLSGAGALADLAQLLRDGRSEVRGFVKDFLLPKDQADVRLGLEGVPRRPYSDPLLHRPREHERLLAVMSSKGMIEYFLDVVETCGLFSVWKKSGKQRLIIDARRSSCWFKDPPKTRLASGGSFARLSAAADLTLELGQTDIQDAFYQLAMPVELRPYFGLAPVRAGRVGVSVTVEGSQVSPSTLVYPRLCVLAMGWTRALNWRQRVLEDISSRVPGLGMESRSRETPELRPTVWPKSCASPGCVLTLSKRLSGKDLEVLAGHCAHAFLMRRELLCCFNAVYAFIAKHRHERVPLWEVVRKELRWASHLVCFFWRDLSASVCPVAVSSDASERGRGVTVLEGDKGDIVEAMKYSDRWRIRDGSGGARAQAAELIEEALAGHRVPGERDEGAQPGAVADGEADWGPEGGDRVPLVPERLLKGKWSVLCSRPWKRPEGMPVLETRSTLWGLRHQLRNTRWWGRRLLFLSDSMSATPALSKGRSSAPGMLRAVRAWASSLLVSGCFATVRWIPSELNSADAPSRRGLALGSRGRRSRGANPGPRGAAAAGPGAAPERPLGRRGSAAARGGAAAGARAGAEWPGGGPGRRPRLSAPRGDARDDAREAGPPQRGQGPGRADARPQALGREQGAGGRQPHELLAAGECQAADVSAVPDELGLPRGLGPGAKLPTVTEDELETAVLDYLGWEYFEGVHSSLGSRLVCAACYLRPELSRQRDARRARVRSALRVWSLRSPSQSRLPTLWEVVCLIVDLLVRKGQWDRAALIAVRVVFYLRPSELLDLRTCQLGLPLAASQSLRQRVTLALHPMELGQPSKELGMEVLGSPTLHGLRRAEACLGCALGRRTMLEIQHRGNWAAATRRLAEQLHLPAPGARLAARRCAARIGSIL
ncbi:unnamed protein product, partial [Prorocentrum cordatum]